MTELRIGCSGWNYEHWRNGVFYPPRLPAAKWLQFYAEQFDTVEVNATFYRLPRPTAVANWVALTPRDFAFTIKMSRYVTHVKRLAGVKESLERFYGTIAPIVGTPKFGPVLWQFPETFHRNDERLLGASERELDEWAGRIEGWRRRGLDVYAYFNNDWEGYAIKNALGLKQRLRLS